MAASSIPNPQLLDRHVARENARQVLGRLTDTTEDMVNEGTQLLARLVSVQAKAPRVLHSSLLMLLRHVIEHVDAADELFRAGILSPASLHVRSILEAHMQMLYMAGQRVEFVPSPLEASDVDPIPRDPSGEELIGTALRAAQDRRATAYIVCYFRKQLATSERYVQGTVEAWVERMTGTTAMPQIVLDAPTQAGIQQEIAGMKARLTEPEFQPVSTAFDLARGKRNYDPSWYSIDGGPSSVRALAASVGLAGSYDMFYSPSSEVMHAVHVQGQLGKAKDSGGHPPARLRQPGVLGASVARTLVLQVIQVYRFAIQHIRPADEPLWSQWAERWSPVAGAIE